MHASRQLLQTADPEVYAAIAGEESRQRDGIELIPSENYIYPEVLYAYEHAQQVAFFRDFHDPALITL